jgi:gas vesicle protein
MEDVAPTPMRTPDDEDLNNDTNNSSGGDKNSIPSFIKKTDFKILYQNRIFIISISLTSDKKHLYIQAREENNNIFFFEKRMTSDELKIFDKLFRMCDNLEEAYSNMITIFNNEKNYIKGINDSKLFITISVLNLDGSFREKNLELLKKMTNKEQVAENLYQKYLELKVNNIKLEQELKNTKEENEKIKENFQNFKNEITQEISELKNRIKNLESKSSMLKSKIFKKKEDLDFLIERLKKVDLNDNVIKEENENISITLNLLYRASRDGDESKQFHSKCDNFKNTLVVVKTKKGLRFGGFTSETWNGNGIDKKDKNAFCFSIDKKKIYNSIQDKNAIFACPDFGPAFENCIFEIKDKCFEFGGLCSDESQNYFDNHESVCEINNGEEQFDVEDIEVFLVLFEKED